MAEHFLRGVLKGYDSHSITPNDSWISSNMKILEPPSSYPSSFKKSILELTIGI